MVEGNNIRMVFFLKPDAVVRRYVGARTLKEITSMEGVKPLTFIKFIVERDFLADYHYAEHKGKRFFDWLISYNTLAPIILVILELDSPQRIQEIRKRLGPTLTQKAVKEAPRSIRGKYGVYGGANVAHASDSPESARREYEKWMMYLKEKGYGLNSEEAIKKIEEYVEKYLDFPIIDNVRYIELIEEFKSGKLSIDALRERMIKLLKKETDDEFDSEVIKKLAEGIIENALL